MKRNNPEYRKPNLDSLNQGQRVPPSNQIPRNTSHPHNHPAQGRPAPGRPAQGRPVQGRPVYSRPQNSAGNASTVMRPDPNSRRRKRKKKASAKQVVLRVLFVFLALVILLGIGLFIYKDHLENQITYIPHNVNPSMKNEDGSIVSISDVATETTTVAMPSIEGIHNILLIGIDSRSSGYTEDGSGNLADIIIILTINENDNTMKLTSVQRDSYVYIPGYTDPQKINAAMTYGGPPLLMLVLENHLRINLEQYAFVNMSHMEKVINAVGGVTVYVSESERTNPLGGLNELVAEQNVIFGSPVDSHKLYETGTVTLDGRQGVAYARIRKVGNGDYERSQRQVEVLESLLHRFMDLGLTGKANAVTEILSLISTNMTKNDIEKYAFTFLPKIKSAEFEYLQIPVEGYANEGTFSDYREGEWSIRPNWNGLIPIVQQYMFGQTFAFDPAPVIAGAPTEIPTPSPAEEDTQAGGN